MSINVRVSPIPSANILVGASDNLLNISPQNYLLHSDSHSSGAIDAVNHNSLAGLQGGSSGDFYHLNSGQYFNLVTGEVIRPSDTGNFYPISNPAGFITPNDLTDFVTASSAGLSSVNLGSNIITDGGNF